MKVTDDLLCTAMDAHRNWLRDNCTKEERLLGIDGFGAWHAALEAVFSMQEDTIKKFVELIARTVIIRHSFYEAVSNDFNHGALSVVESLYNSPEYQALKASIDEPKEEKKEPEKQTLLESVYKYTDIDTWTPSEVIEFISGYLEQCK